MNKISKNLLVGATVLTLGVFMLASVAPAFAIDVNDGDTIGGGDARDDLNNLPGAVADSELVEIEVEPVLSIATANPGYIATINGVGNTTALAGGPADMPADMVADTPGDLVEGGSSQVIKSNNLSGYYMSIMMCNSAAAAPYTTVVLGCRGGTTLESDTTSGVILMTDGTTTSGKPSVASPAATDGGYWGYRYSATTSAGAAAILPAGNWLAVPTFTASATYGTQLVTSSVAGAAAVNVNFGAVTSNSLPAGVYNNYVIYTAVQNP